MKVFISWSGPQSKHIAHALRGWLCEVIQTLDPWMSELDIGAGQQWAIELGKGLQDSHFGVVCLTADNLRAPWLHYEAGALAKTVDNRVCPYLYKIEPSVVQGPLSQLDMVQADKQGTKDLVQSINTVIKIFNEKDLLTNEKSLSTEQLNKAFSRCWPELEKDLNDVPPSTAPTPPQRETQGMVEEILEIVRKQSRPPLYAELDFLSPEANAQLLLLEQRIQEIREMSSSKLLPLNRKLVVTSAGIRGAQAKRRREVKESTLPSDTPQGGKPPSK